MYVQHPYKYEGKYYAKIDGVFYEISKEVAMAMFAEYRNEIYRSRKWAPESEEDDQMEDFQDLENKQEKEEPADQKDKKWKRKTKRCEILDCAFSANSDGLSIADMADDTQMSMEEMVILKEESRMLHEKIGKLSLQEVFLPKSVAEMLVEWKKGQDKIKETLGDSGHSQINMVTDVYSHIIDDDRRKNAELFEEAFYEKKDLDPSMHAHAAGKTVELPTDVDAELLAKVLSNPEMAALLSTLAKSLEKK